ncbi:hypothetical protein [Natronincola ferrireducens]|uniref:BNR repeat-like domain-containing protein n=1 Tax=Natronincola ferrireducens TaxID=393762 RepID=A0A1G9CTJ9_9FIRM|nr:hypothetical protein [Natronincola ferrireducens]SDK55021.1 hypothetical protein SAMN05660472_01553 [Natronincola ferrireducens]
MGLLKDFEFVIRDTRGKIYNFYLNENKQIEYIVTNNENQWAKKDVLLKKAMVSFSIDIDEKDEIHVVSFSSEGILYYHLFQKNKWHHQKIVDYSKGSGVVYYPSIKQLQDKLHIFYYFVEKNNENLCNMVHLTKYQEKWTKEDVLDSSYKKLINPFKILTHGESIYVLYASIHQNFNQVYVVSYNNISNQWSEPLQITNSPIDKLYLYGLLDAEKNLHITWSTHLEEGLTVEYIKYPLEEINEPPMISSLSEKLNCSFPLLLIYNNALWCVWTQMNKLYACYSTDHGDSWSPPMVRPESQGINFKKYYYKSNYDEEVKGMLSDTLYGTLYPKIQFIGFGGEIT